jgi:uncharacterized protein YndB with AHSA1/START domain
MDHSPRPLIEIAIEVDAPLDVVWSLVSDPTASARWSPNVISTVVTTDGPVGVGTRMTNHNRMGDVEWDTYSEVVEHAAPTSLAFRMKGSGAIWSFRLSPISANRCRVTQCRTAPNGISDQTLELESAVFGSVEAFELLLADGMTQTLAHLRAEAESLAREEQ